MNRDEIPLRRLFKIVNGGTPNPDPKNWTDEVPWATPVDIGVHDGSQVSETLRSISELGVQSGSRTVPAGSLLLSTRAPIGYVAEVTKRTAFNQGCRGLEPIADVEPRFFLYHLMVLRPDLVAMGAGSTFVELATESLASVRLIRPSLEEQRRIAEYLDREAKRVRELQAGYKLMKETLLERKQKLIDDTVSKGGHPVPLKHHVRFREGPGIMAEDFRESGIPLIRIAGLQDGSVTAQGANFLEPEMVASRWSKYRLRIGDYVVSGSATMGEVSVVRDPAVEGAVPYTGLIILRPAAPSVWMEYVATALRSSDFYRQVDLLKAGAIMQHFGPSHLSRISIPIPVFARQRELAAEVREIDDRFSQLLWSIDRQGVLLFERLRALVRDVIRGNLDVTTARGVGV